jgi:hypothetical protein
MVKTGGRWGWVRWSETYEGARKALAGWQRIPTLTDSYIGECREVEK